MYCVVGSDTYAFRTAPFDFASVFESFIVRIKAYAPHQNIDHLFLMLFFLTQMV